MKKTILLIGLIFTCIACEDHDIAPFINLKGDCKGRAVHTAFIAIEHDIPYEIVYGHIEREDGTRDAHLHTRIKFAGFWFWITLDDANMTSLHTIDEYSDFKPDPRYQPYDIHQVIERTRVLWRSELPYY